MVPQRLKTRSVAAQKLFASVGFLVMAATLIYFYYQSELHLFLPVDENPNGSQRTLVKRRPQARTDGLSEKFSFVIKVLAYDRLESVSRCLESLARADYVKDRVKLHVFIDHFQIEEQGSSAGTVDIDSKLNNAHQILEYVDKFDWKHGEKVIHYRTQNAGLQAQWLEAWWPSSEDEFAFIVEDDMVLSPLFYRYLRALIANYYYNPANSNPSIYGVSLQRPRFVGGKHGNKLKVDNDTRLFLYQMVGTWGQLLFPKPWKEFCIWYDMHKSKGIKPILEGMITTGWYRRKREKIWTPWFIKFIHARGYYNIYTNFLLDRALSISYRDAGVNYGKNIGPDSHLMNSSDILDFDLWEMKPLKLMEWYDFCFQKVLPYRYVKRLDQLEPVLSSVHKQKTVVLVNLFGVPDAIVRNLLCQFQKLGIRSYILLGGKSTLLDDLSRRGHAVIDANQLIDDMATVGIMDHRVSRAKEMREALATTYIMNKSLQLGYSIWLTRANTFPIEDLFSISSDIKNDVLILETKQHLRTEVLYFRSSVSTIKLWNKVFAGLMSKAQSSVVDDLSKVEHILAFQLRSSIIGVGFKMKSIDASIMMQVGSSAINPGNATSTQPIVKILFWPSNKDADYVKKHLKDRNLWMVDDELACTSIVCHQL